MPPGGQFTSDSDLESVLSLQVGNAKLRRNSVGNKYFCSINGCDASFKRLDHLDRHEFKHTGIKKHACHYEGCSKIYSILTHLKRHIRCTHERPNMEPNKTIPCEVDTCDKLFTSLSNMQRHIREVHENPKVYKCQHCDEKFRHKLKMRRHEISQHTGVYPYTCEKCSKGFYQKWQLEKHEETCQVYECLTCNQKFEKWSLFLKHCKDTQHVRHYYKCEYCKSAYVKPSDLQKHVAAKHISEKDGNNGAGEYKCIYENCQRTYAYERNLRQHIATVHKGKKFECTENNCDKEFSSLQNLQKHIQRDHSSECQTSSRAVKNFKKNLKRKKRKDAGTKKVSNLAKVSGIIADTDLHKRLKTRDKQALEEVAQKLSQDMDVVDSSFSEQELLDENQMDKTKEEVTLNEDAGKFNDKNDLKPKKREDAGTKIFFNLANLSGFSVDSDLHKRLITEDEQAALEENDDDWSFSEQELLDGNQMEISKEVTLKEENDVKTSVDVKAKRMRKQSRIMIRKCN